MASGITTRFLQRCADQLCEGARARGHREDLPARREMRPPLAREGTISGTQECDLTSIALPGDGPSTTRPAASWPRMMAWGGAHHGRESRACRSRRSLIVFRLNERLARHGTGLRLVAINERVRRGLDQGLHLARNLAHPRPGSGRSHRRQRPSRGKPPRRAGLPTGRQAMQVRSSASAAARDASAKTGAVRALGRSRGRWRCHGGTMLGDGARQLRDIVRSRHKARCRGRRGRIAGSQY